MAWDHALLCRLDADIDERKIIYYDFFPIKKGPRKLVHKEYCKDTPGNCAHCMRYFSHTHHFICLLSDPYFVTETLDKCDQKGGCGIEFSKTYEGLAVPAGKYCLKCAANVALVYPRAFKKFGVVKYQITKAIRYAAQSAADDNIKKS